MSQERSDLSSQIKSFQEKLESMSTTDILEMLYAALYGFTLEEVKLPEHQGTIAMLVQLTLLSNKLSDNEDPNKYVEILKTMINTLQTSGKLADQKSASYVQELIERFSEKIKNWQDENINLRGKLLDIIQSIEDAIKDGISKKQLNLLRETVKNINLNPLIYAEKRIFSTLERLRAEGEANVKTAGNFVEPHERIKIISKHIPDIHRK